MDGTYWRGVVSRAPVSTECRLIIICIVIQVCNGRDPVDAMRDMLYDVIAKNDVRCFHNPPMCVVTSVPCCVLCTYSGIATPASEEGWDGTDGRANRGGGVVPGRTCATDRGMLHPV